MFGFGRDKSAKPDDVVRSAKQPAPWPDDPSSDLDSELFFNKYRPLLPPDEFEQFRTLVGKIRASPVLRYYVRPGQSWLGLGSSYANGPMDPRRSEDADLSKMEVLIVQDVDVRRLLVLDDAYQLDPQFVLAYAGVGDKHSPEFDKMTDSAGMAGKWYVTEMSILLESPWETEDSMTVKRAAALELPWYKWLLAQRRAPEENPTHPWWKEAVRSEKPFINTTIRSKVACYCLTDKLRLVLVESLPRIVQPSHRAAPDYSKVRLQDTNFHLPIPMTHSAQQPPFDFFGAWNHSISTFGFPHPQVRYAILSDEATPSELTHVAKLLDERMILAPFFEDNWRTHVEGLSRQLSQSRAWALKRPNTRNYQGLLDLRRLILEMLNAVSAAMQDVPGFEEAYNRVHTTAASSSSSTSETRSPWFTTLQNATARLHALQRELNEEVPFVIGAATVQQVDASKRWAERATLFALVIVVYLPLTLVASVFGMNIREVDGGHWTFRACLEALAVVVGGTVVFVWACRRWRRWRRDQLWWSEMDHLHLQKYA